MTKYLSIRGAREHNLKNIDLDLPRDQLIVITGLSGSGKSSLAFDTIYAEGQRRYVESLSAYARQFLELMQKPDVDLIEGLSPAISIEQKTTSKNPRSTVGTVTEIYDYLRLLYARCGTPYSPTTGLPIESQTVSQMVDRLLLLPDKTRFLILAPVVRGRKGEYRKELLELQKRGFQRVKIDDEYYQIDQAPTLNKKLKHDILVVVDRVEIGAEGLAQRLADSLETALELADGLVFAEVVDRAQKPLETLTFSAKFACPVSGFTIESIEPRLFSFNNPFGACPTCDGLGVKFYFDPLRVVPDEAKSLQNGAIAPWAGQTVIYYEQALQSLAAAHQVSMRAPWNSLPESFTKLVLYGSGGKKVAMEFSDSESGEPRKGSTKKFATNTAFEGVIPNLERRWRATESNWMREDLERYQSRAACDDCRGFRLKPESLAVKINHRHIGEVSALSIAEAVQWFGSLRETLSVKNQEISVRILKEINERLGFLQNVGLDYLTLSRNSGTLSGGESQRIRLASQIGSGLTGVLYVLDEPSIGLHQRDNERLLTTLKRLRDLGNTVIVVEHDEEAIRAANYLVDMGPGAGIHGGEIIAQGTPAEVTANPNSLTGDYLAMRKFIPLPAVRRRGKPKQSLKIIGAQGNNLKNVSVTIPLGKFICVTGVSGGGKSTLIVETLYKALAHRMNGARELPAPHERIEGMEFIDKIIDIDQSPIGRTPRSNPATYTGAFAPLRDWYAQLPESQARGYGPGRFSFNVKGGRCEACQGDGVIKIEMHFLPDVFVQCDVCKGQRYNRETLEVRFKDRNIAQVLDMTVEEGAEFFRAVPQVRDRLATLARVGLGYIRIGQQATTLSGGEAQRVKLAKELARRATGQTLYILDEPTTGLHVHDVRKLLEVLQALVDQGNTVLVIEHNLDVIKTADWIIDLGPDGGDKGGQIVAQGTPEEVAQVAQSHTARYLASALLSTPPEVA